MADTAHLAFGQLDEHAYNYTPPVMSIPTVSAKDLKRASKIKEQIEKQESELASILKTAGAAISSSPTPTKRKRKMSATAKAKISAAQKKRWQKRKSAVKK